MDIKGNLSRIKEGLPEGVRLIVISKTRSPEEIMEVYSSGHRFLGENKVQELIEKQQQLPAGIEWHMVGHLQTNKVKFIAPFIKMIHSVDSVKLLKTISKEAVKNKRAIDCLLQVHIAAEESKFGFSEEEIVSLSEMLSSESLEGVRIRGLMGMATFTDDEDIVRGEFRSLASLFGRLKSDFFGEKGYFTELSMGMSDDYNIAVEEGSTMVRIGSLIFGERIYS